MQTTVSEKYTKHWDTEKKSLYEQKKILYASLIERGWEYLEIDPENSYQELKNNLRRQLERFNNCSFSEDEWIDVYRELVRADNGIEDIWIRIQKHNTVTIDQGIISKRYTLLDKQQALNNHFQFLVSYPPLIENSSNPRERCNFTLLINGLPLVHIELQEPRGQSLNRALNHTKSLFEDNFYLENPIYQLLHIFVISNGSKTRYFAAYQAPTKCPTLDKTSRWADSEHTDIDLLEDFAHNFFDRKILWSIITKYSLVSTPKDSEGGGKKELVILRSYQIDATEKIMKKIKTSLERGLTEKKTPGGYIWHATGSGKTLTSFKASELAISVSEKIQKVLFVVDRIDLDIQTFDVFQSVQDNTEVEVYDASSRVNLWGLIEDDERAIIITTIHKLGNLVRKELKDKKVEKYFVLIFDECHRSLGHIFSEIKEIFQHHCIIFGFTGTPIFPPKTKEGEEQQQISYSHKERPTEWLFGEELARYTLLDALDDENVLPFKVAGIEVPIQASEELGEKNIERLDWIVRDIVEHFDERTQRKKGRKFSALFATNSVSEAIEYYGIFKKYLDEKKRKLKIAVIFSEDDRRLAKEKPNEKSTLVESWKNFTGKELTGNSDYLSEDQKKKYKKSLSEAIQEVKLDLLIVVDMFLTGFDAPRLNALFLDKDMRQRHSIIQAFARTNRTSKDKRCGRIYWYSGDRQNMEEAVKEYGGRESSQGMLIDDKYYQGCKQKLDNLKLSLEKNREEIQNLEALRVEWDTYNQELENRLSRKKKEFWKESKEMEEVFSLYQEFEEFASEKDDQELATRIEEYRTIAKEYYSQLEDDEQKSLDETLESRIVGPESRRRGRKRWRVDKPKQNIEWGEEIDQEYIERLIDTWKNALKDIQKPYARWLNSWKQKKPEEQHKWEVSWKNYLDSNNFITECSENFANSFLGELEDYKVLEFQTWVEKKIKMNEKIIAEEIDNWFPGESFFSESFTEKKEEFFREFEEWYKGVRQFYNFSVKDLAILLGYS